MKLEVSFSLRQFSKPHASISISKDAVCSPTDFFFHVHFYILVSDWEEKEKMKFDKAVE